MAQSTSARVKRREVSSAAQLLHNLAMAPVEWWSKRRTAREIAELTPEQLRDMGLELPNLPTIEVPRGLMVRLMSGR